MRAPVFFASPPAALPGGLVGAQRAAIRSEVAGIITDAPAGHPAVRQFREQGVHVIEA